MSRRWTNRKYFIKEVNFTPRWTRCVCKAIEKWKNIFFDVKRNIEDEKKKILCKSLLHQPYIQCSFVNVDFTEIKLKNEMIEKVKLKWSKLDFAISASFPPFSENSRVKNFIPSVHLNIEKNNFPGNHAHRMMEVKLDMQATFSRFFQFLSKRKHSSTRRCLSP